ncbi:MAG TPA: nuclear transport factor 2 family protein [Egibacteraceae bacterium]|nr:nuclear transport factor 2 family protein [Egibacteraceae bacterium]
MTGHDNETGAEVVRKLHQAFNGRDRDTLLGCLAEDVAWHVEGDHLVAGTYQGRDGLWEGFMGPMWASPARVQDHDVLDHGQHVVALEDVFHDFGEGEQRWKTVEVFRLENGRVVERWGFTSHQAELDRLFARGCAADMELG